MADVSQIKLPNGSVYDLIDEKSGYITAEYIENKTDYEIPVSRVGEIVVGETAIGTDSTNFPTSKAVVDYVDERVVQEIEAIDVGVTSVNGKTGSVTLSASDVGAITRSDLNNELDDFGDYIQGQIPTSTSQLTNDSGFITASDIPKNIDEKLAIDLFGHSSINSAIYYPILGKNSGSISSAARRSYDSEFKYEFTNGTTVDLYIGSSKFIGRLSLKNNDIVTRLIPSATSQANLTLPNKTGTIALTSDIPTVPTTISAFTNDSGYLTASDIASVMTYKGTKANYAALPSTGNTTGDVWHLTDTGAEWAWDGSAWQELGTAIDLSGYVPVQSRGTSGSRNVRASITNENGKLTLAGWDLDDGGYLRPNYNGLLIIDNGGVSLGYYTNNSRTASSFPIRVQPSGVTITNVITPTSNTDAANKKYVDDSMATIPAWAKAVSKPTYTATEVGAISTSHVVNGITSTDISNWNAKSDTDEKLAVSDISVTSAQTYYPIFGDNNTSAATRQYDTTGLRYQVSTDYSELILGYTNPNKKGEIALFNSGYYKKLQPSTLTSSGIIYLPDKNGTIALTSDIPDTSSFLTSETDPIFGASAAAGITSTDISNWNGKTNTNISYDSSSRTLKKTVNGTTSNVVDFGTAAFKLYTTTVTSDGTSLPTSAAVASFVEGKGYITGYTETDPVFSASAAAGITATDISNWNAKVSDDKTWNGVSLTKTTSVPSANTKTYIPYLTSTSGTGAILMQVVNSPTANSIVRYDGSAYLYSTTPSANDNSTKVATTAYVDAAIPNTSGFVSKSGDTMTGNLTMSANKLIFSINDSANIVIKHGQGGMQAPILDVSAAENGSIYIRGVRTPSSTTDAANKQYVDDSIPKVYSSTNTGGYLTMATLPIYDGTVV